MSLDAVPVTDPLALVALDTERHVAGAGWDQPMRLFALVPTAELVDSEPHLAGSLARHDVVEGALSAVEQDDLPNGHRVDDVLAQVAWPDQVVGCALAVERVVIPPDAEHDLPADEAEALAAVARHPHRKDVRLVVAVTRDGRSICLLRQRDHDQDDRVATGENLAPGLVHAVRETLRPD
ncbi:MAG: PPA1309 family protein [Dermatophilaceae bacterium]